MKPQTESEPQPKTALFSHPFSRIPFNGKMLDISELLRYNAAEDEQTHATIHKRVEDFIDKLYANGYRLFVIAGASRGLNNIIACRLTSLILDKKYDVAIYYLERFDERYKLMKYSSDKVFFTPYRQIINGTDKTAELMRLLDM